MSDTPTAATVPAADTDRPEERWAAYETRLAELHPVNKASLFAALAAAGVTRVTVSFNGCGDEGRIEQVLAFAGEDAVELPNVDVAVQTLDFHAVAPRVRTQPLGDAVEALADAMLNSAHRFWEDGEGAFGEFVFDVGAGAITLDFNAQFVESTNHTHEF